MSAVRLSVLSVCSSDYERYLRLCISGAKVLIEWQSFKLNTAEKKLRNLFLETAVFMSDGDKEDRFYDLQVQSVGSIQCQFIAKCVTLLLKRLLQGFLYEAILQGKLG